MTLLDAIRQLEQIRQALERTYPGAFRQPLPYGTGTHMPPRYGWEVRLAGGHKKLGEAIDRLRSTVAEADPSELNEVN